MSLHFKVYTLTVPLSSFTHLPPHSPTRFLTPSLIHPPVRSLTPSLTPPFTHSLTHSTSIIIHSPPRSITLSLTSSHAPPPHSSTNSSTYTPSTTRSRRTPVHSLTRSPAHRGSWRPSSLTPGGSGRPGPRWGGCCPPRWGSAHGQCTQCPRPGPRARRSAWWCLPPGSASTSARPSSGGRERETSSRRGSGSMYYYSHNLRSSSPIMWLQNSWGEEGPPKGAELRLFSCGFLFRLRLSNKEKLICTGGWCFHKDLKCIYTVEVCTELITDNFSNNAVVRMFKLLGKVD